MSDIIMHGEYTKQDCNGKVIVINRVQRHQNNKYSKTFNFVKDVMNLRRATAILNKERQSNEQKENCELESKKA